MKFDNTVFDLPQSPSNIIKVIGLGGGGGNAVNHMFRQNVDGVDYIICNTDVQVLEKSPILNKIQLGKELTGGLGAGANPEIGKEAAVESLDEIKASIGHNAKMAFITAGMGGGTGTGAAPVVANLCKEMGVLSVGIVTTPFSTEGPVRMAQAQKGIAELRKYLDSLIIINNDRLRDIYGNLGYRSGLAKVDEVLTIAVHSIAEIITQPFDINIDFHDVSTVLKNSGTAIMGTGRGSGESRALDAIKGALNSPLLDDNKITNAKDVLLLIVSGEEEITFDEIGQIEEYIQIEANKSGFKTNIIKGLHEDKTLGKDVSVTIVATGFSSEQQRDMLGLEPEKVVYTSGDITVTKEFEVPAPISSGITINNSQPPKKVIKVLDEDDFNNDFPSNKKDEQPISAPVISPISVINKEQKDNNFGFRNIELCKVLVEFEEITPQITSKKIELPEKSEKIQPITVAAHEEEFIIHTHTPIKERKVEVAPPLLNSLFGDNEITATQEETKSSQDNTDKVVLTLDEEEYIRGEEQLIQASSADDGIYVKEVEQKKIDKPNYGSTIEETPYTDALRESAISRKQVFNKYSHDFRNDDALINDFEKEPAYKRKGIDPTSSSAEQPHNFTSRISISSDSNGNTQIRDNNSFLHDRVD